MTKIAFLISGNGSFARLVYKNLHLLMNTKFSLIISDRASKGYEYFSKFSKVPCFNIEFRSTKSKIEFEKKILEKLLEFEINYLFLTYNRLIGKTLLNAFPYKIFNLHLSTLPLFKGFSAIKKAYESDVLFYGATIHLINEKVDAGPIISQVVLGKAVSDNYNSFQHRLYQHAGILLIDTIHKLSTSTLLNRNNKFFFENAVYGSLPFNPQVDIDISKIDF